MSALLVVLLASAESPKEGTPGDRAAVSMLTGLGVTLSTTLIGGGIGYGIGAAVTGQPSGWTAGFSLLAGLSIGGLASMAAAPLMEWLVFRGMGGTGRGSNAAVGLAVGGGAALVILGATAAIVPFAGRSTTVVIISGGTLAVVALSVLPLVMFQSLSSKNEVTVVPVFAPVSGGAVGGVAFSL